MLLPTLTAKNAAKVGHPAFYLGEEKRKININGSLVADGGEGYVGRGREAEGVPGDGSHDGQG
jgi:hypothetical protein